MSLLTYFIIKYKIWRIRRHLRILKKSYKAIKNATQDILYLATVVKNGKEFEVLRNEFTNFASEILTEMVKELGSRFVVEVDVEGLETDERNPGQD